MALRLAWVCIGEAPRGQYRFAHAHYVHIVRIVHVIRPRPYLRVDVAARRVAAGRSTGKRGQTTGGGHALSVVAMACARMLARGVSRARIAREGQWRAHLCTVKSGCSVFSQLVKCTRVTSAFARRRGDDAEGHAQVARDGRAGRHLRRRRGRAVRVRGAEARRVDEPERRRVVEEQVEKRARVEERDLVEVAVLLLEGLHARRELRVVVRERGRDLRDRRGPLLEQQRRAVRRRHGEEEERARAAGVELLHLFVPVVSVCAYTARRELCRFTCEKSRVMSTRWNALCEVTLVCSRPVSHTSEHTRKTGSHPSVRVALPAALGSAHWHATREKTGDARHR